MTIKKPTIVRPSKKAIASFIKKNDCLFLLTRTEFDASEDSTEYRRTDFKQVVKHGDPDSYPNTLGIDGIWISDTVKNYYSNYEDKNFVGFRCDNACGSFVIVTKK